MWPSGQECNRQVNSVATDNRIEGSSLVYPTLLLTFSKMFLRISMNAIYISNRLDSQSDYSDSLPVINIYNY